MQRVSTISWLMLCLVLGVVSASIGSDSIAWLALKEGAAKAKAEQKPMIVDFYFGKGCLRCEALQKGVYDNPAIAQRIAREFIPIRIDLTKKLTAEEEKLGTRYDYKNECLLLFLEPDGAIIKEPSGKRLCFIDAVDPDWFMSYLDMIKAGFRKGGSSVR